VTAELLDGRLVARQIRSKVKEQIKALADSIVAPSLVSILVGDDPVSRAYLRNNEAACAEVGIKFRNLLLRAEIRQEELERVIKELNSDGSVTGILLHLPLPDGLNDTVALSTISREKDVDGLNPCNLGLLAHKNAALVPCTPNGIIVLLKYYKVSLVGKHVVVINRSKPVGRPLSQLLLNEDATVTVCHSKTQGVTEISKTADVLITGIGRRDKFVVDSRMMKPGAVVVDVGTTSMEGKIVGDVDFEAALGTASYVTPVPGGVGPMTTAMLLYNAVLAACLQSRVDAELGIEHLVAA
jgi:methylenetetrahydrofolate dehydrogenase (NADP+)/methenyltetrahydrofolate cyclohydrolase